MRERPRFPRAFRLPWRSDRHIADEVEEEVGFHLEMRAAELEGEGVTPAEARRRALAEFGDPEAAKRALRADDQRGERGRRRGEWLAEVRQDAAHGWRQLARRPGFAVLAIGTLAVGIGAATTIFSLADHVLLRPLPYAGVERAVTLWETDASEAGTRREVSAGNYLDWAERTRAFHELALAEPYGFDLTGRGRPEPVNAWLVTERFFAAVGAAPLVGRLLEAADHAPGADPAVLLSERLWRSRFGSDPGVVGRRIELNGEPVTVVGVMPAWLEYPGRAEVWAPKRFLPREQDDRESGYLRAVGRLRPGVSLAEAQADLDRVAAQLAVENPVSNARAGVVAVPLAETILGDVRPALLVLLAAVGLLLLVVCANLASLLLARSVERAREMGVRRALGAGGARILRQLLVESFVLAALGGALGIALAVVGVRGIGALTPDGLPRLDAVAIDGRILGFALATTLATALLFGAAPALRLARPSAGSLRTGAGLSAGRERGRLRAALVIGELALATVLLVGAGLLGRSFLRLTDNAPGFEVERRATLQLFLFDRNPTREAREQRVGEMLASLRGTPGVEGAAVVTAFPFHPQQISAQDAILVEGRPPPGEGTSRAFTSAASPDYFALMGIPLRAGRGLLESDRADAPRVAVVSETFARRFFPGESPIGKRVRFGVMSAPDAREIVGVVADVRPETLDSEPRAEAFIPYAQSGTGSVTFVVATARETDALLPTLSEAVWRVDPEQAIDHVATVRSLVAGTLAERRFHLSLLGSFSLAALALAALGIYGLISFTTRQRQREIGIRLALGAEPRRMVRMIVREGLRLGVPGVALGLTAGALLSGSMRGMLYGVAPTDPLVFGQLALLLLAVAALGAYLPARRAAGVDPARSLRAD